MSEADATLDCRGYRCPVPVLRLEARLRAAGPGVRLLVLADDPIATVDIPHFCRESGLTAERLPDRDGACVFLVTRGDKLPIKS
ncbi:MAG: sulfurtransferase TusA family protein [Pseudomonadota bacterium]